MEPIQIDPTHNETPRPGQGEDAPARTGRRDLEMEREKRHYDRCPCNNCERRQDCVSECLAFRVYCGQPSNGAYYLQRTHRVAADDLATATELSRSTE